MKPLAIDLFCGLGGWTEGLLAEGWWVVGFDIERHQYGDAKYPAQLVLQDVLTLHGSRFKDAALIVASPPCQEFSYMAMPWSLAKAKERDLIEGRDDPKRLTALFDACFRIQREAIEAAGHFIPLIVENVRGAQKWVGRSRWNYGSFHLWGDVPALMPITKAVQKFNPDGTAHPPGSWFAVADSKNRGAQGQKVPGFRFDGSGKSFQTASVEESGMKNNGGSWFTPPAGRKCAAKNCPDGRKTGNMAGSSRKAASAAIAKIPFPLSRYIASVFKPEEFIRAAM